jgi:DNA-directed RNA polymerase subunit RPC12/RpoP
MGVYSEYLERQMEFDQLSAERKLQLQRIGEIRGGRDVLVYASDLNSPQAPISVAYADLLPINDQLANLSGDGLDLILETPGGSGEVAEDIVNLLHKKYEDVAVIVPGTAKSAGTLMVMAADEILMEPASSLGPIDAQIQWQGKVFSADALIEGLEAIKDEVEEKGSLNKAFIPILQGISPGELQSAENALEFARKLVTEWLATYKFKNWTVHKSTGKEVTQAERRARARDVAKKLCDHRRWLTHGRSIKIDDLEGMKLLITNYAEQGELSDAIRRYHTLLQMTFDTSIYKLFETPHSQIYRWEQEAQGPPPQMPMPPPEQLASAQIGYKCGSCGETFKLQLNFVKEVPIQDGAMPFPADNHADCPRCGTKHDLSPVREQVEAQAGKAVVA